MKKGKRETEIEEGKKEEKKEKLKEVLLLWKIFSHSFSLLNEYVLLFIPVSQMDFI